MVTLEICMTVKFAYVIKHSVYAYMPVQFCLYDNIYDYTLRSELSVAMMRAVTGAIQSVSTCLKSPLPIPVTPPSPILALHLRQVHQKVRNYSIIRTSAIS